MLKLLVTRPEPDLRATLQRLQALDIEGVAAPVLERAPLHTSLPDPQGFAALALTSTNALRALIERQALAPFLGLKVFAVGDKTADAARAAGFAEVTASAGTFQHLVADIAAARLAGPLFYPAARHQSGDLARALAPAGVLVVVTRVYEMRAAPALPETVVAGLGAGAYAGALFYSRRTAESFVGLAAPVLAPAARADLTVFCLSEQVAKPLLAARFTRVQLAEHPSENAMMALALAFARAQNRP